MPPVRTKIITTTVRPSTRDSQLLRAYQEAAGHTFFQNGCCIPTIQAIWMLVIMILTILCLVGSCCLLTFLYRWIYKKRLYKKTEKYMAKYAQDDTNKKEMEIAREKLNIKPNTSAYNTNMNVNMVNTLTNDVQLARLQKNMISREIMQQQSFAQFGASRENQTPLKSMMTKSHSLPPLPLIVHKPVSNVTPTVVYSTSTTTNGTTGVSSGTNGITSTTSGVSTGTTEDTTGSTVADSRITVDTLGEKDSRFDMKHETLAAALGLMATHCANEKLNKKELRIKPPILYTKNPRRMDDSLGRADVSSSFIDTDSTPIDAAIPMESDENLNKTRTPPSELSVSIPTVSIDDEEGDKKKKPRKTVKKSMQKKNIVKPAAAVPPKQASLTTIEEDEEYKPEYSDRVNWKTGSTFPYYKDSPVKKKKSLPLNTNVSPSVVKADRCLSTSATTRLTEDQQRSSYGVYGQNAYAANKSSRMSPYDIGYFMDGSSSQRG